MKINLLKVQLITISQEGFGMFWLPRVMTWCKHINPDVLGQSFVIGK